VGQVNRRTVLGALAGCTAGRVAAVLIPIASPTLSQAQQASTAVWPSRPVRILVGFTPGGVPDIAARVLSQRLAEPWRQPVLVENRLGAGSNVAAHAVATAAPDGYTLLSVSSAHAVAPAIYPKLNFDPVADFAPITLTATGPALVIVSPDLPVKNMGEFLALARSRPGALNYASAGVGSGAHFAVELLRSQTGIDMVHVPHKGIPEALNETIAGRTQLFISPYASAVNLVRQGKAKAIAVTGLSRMPDLPELPTVDESGVRGYEWVFWYGLLAPARTPGPIISRIRADVARVLAEDEVQNRFAALGTRAVPSTPEAFAKLIVDDVASFTRLARAANIRAE
jgi:tripartite-type tricarboxylate transporter receptor subunit TctC